MRIDLLAANDPRLTTTSPLRPMWRVGAILEAVAVRDVTSGELWLSIDNQRLPARLASGNTTGPVDGEQLKLRVLRSSPVLALESVDETNSTQVANDALRRYLPRQAASTPLLANLGWLARGTGNRSLLPTAISDTLGEVWNSLPDASALHDSAQLQTALRSSGGFFEAQLLRMATAANGAQTADLLHTDFKAQLLALREQLKSLDFSNTNNNPPPPGPLPMLQGPLHAMPTGPASLAALDTAASQLNELKQQTDGVLARINTTQLLNAEAAHNGVAAWLIEVPIRRDDRAELLRFKFERDARREASGESAWSVEVAMDLGSSGALHAQVNMTGSRLNVRLRSDTPRLVETLSDQLEVLRSALQEQGLKVDQVVCLHGNPVDDARSRLSHLLDFHA